MHRRSLVVLAWIAACSSDTAGTSASGDASASGTGTGASSSSSGTTSATSSVDTTGTTTGTSESSGPITATDPSGDPSTCEEEPPCKGVTLDHPVEPSSGWAQGGDGAPLTIFLSRPGTSCGDDNPAGCTDCGNYESISIGLPPGAELPGSYTEADGAALDCGSIVSDCMGNGEGEGSPSNTYTIEITSIDASCVVGEIVASDGCATGQFAVSRCPPA